MTAFLDTNIIVRHLTGDPEDQAARATAFLVSADDLVLTSVVVAETVYVLESFYGASRVEVARALRTVIAAPSIRTAEAPSLLRALELYEGLRLDFAEAYLVACAESTGVLRVASFDKAIDRVPTVARVEPGLSA